jgi:hypothetical protein
MGGPGNDSLRFVRLLFTLILAGWALVGAINLCVDPYAAVGWSSAFGLDDDGSGFFRNTRFSKAFAVARVQPEDIALGTSRVDHGIDVTHPGFSREVGPAYNLGLSGAHIDELLAYLEHAQFVRPLRRVVVGLDLESFGKFQRQGAFDPDILATRENDHAIRRWAALIGNSFSGEALIQSIRKLRQQGAAPIYDLGTGRRTDRIFLERIAACGGVRQAFREQEARDIQRWAGVRSGDVDSSGTAEDFRASLESFRKFVRFAQDQNINLYLFISPTHAMRMEELRLLGQWGGFEDWVRSLVGVVAEENARNPSATPTPLWDFSGYNSITTERVPEPENATMQMRGYWEPSHYRKRIGDMILDRIFDRFDPLQLIPSDFGRRVTPQNVDQHLLNLADAGARYRAQNPAELVELEALVQTKGRTSFRPGCDSGSGLAYR